MHKTKTKLIQKGNSKLVDMIMFNLPASKEVCGRLCNSCYAHREQQRYPTVLPARTMRLEATRQLDFVSRIKSEINSLKTKPKYFRIHASGDFYDQPYINKWVSIIQSFPNIVFYAYTKRKKNFDFSQLESLPNCIIIDSFHFGGLNYGKLEKAPTGAFICPHQKGANITCGGSGINGCTYCMSKQAQINSVFFIQH